MNDPETFELINIATNPTMTLRIGRGRFRVLFGLVKQGYLLPLKEKDNPAFDPALLAGLEDNTTLILTDKAKAWILALDPADFEAITWFPRAKDVRNAQRRLAERQPAVPGTNVPRGIAWPIQPAGQQGETMIEHEQVILEHPHTGEEIAVDRGLAPLLAALWKWNIETLNSCENNVPPDYMWIEFASSADAENFLALALSGKRDSLYQRATEPDVPGAWLYSAVPGDESYILTPDDILEPDGPPGIRLGISVRFPVSDYPAILAYVLAYGGDL